MVFITPYLTLLVLLALVDGLEVGLEYTASGHAARKCCTLMTGLASGKAQARSSSALESVIQCLNASISTVYQTVQNYNAPYTSTPSPKHGPSRSISIITRITPEIYSYATYSTFLQIYWAQKQGYSYIPFMDTYDAVKERRKGYNDDYRYHRKLTLILESLKTPAVYKDIDVYGKNHGNKVHRDQRRLKGMAFTSDYIMWMDADAVPLDPFYQIEDIIREYPEAHLLISADASSVANTGIFIMKNSEWSVAFLELWLELRGGLVEQIVNEHTQESVHYHATDIDQAGFASAVELYQKRYGLNYVSRYIRILPPHRLNSVPPAMSLQQSHHKWLHLAAEDDGYRTAVFMEGATRVCNSHVTTQTPASQSGMHQRFLVEKAVTYYSQHTKVHLQRLRDILGYGSSRSDDKGGDGIDGSSRKVYLHKATVGYDLAAVRTIVSKYCHALKYSLESADTPSLVVKESIRGVKIRYEVYQLMREWVDINLLIAQATTNITSTRFNYEKVDASFSDPGLEGLAGYGGIFEGEGGSLEDIYGDLGRDGARFQGREDGVPLTVGKDNGVSVYNYRGCYDQEVFEDPETYDPSLPTGSRSDPTKQVKYCKTNLLDAVLMRLPDTMKLTAELTYDYMHALESITDDVYHSFLDVKSTLDKVALPRWTNGYLLSMLNDGIVPTNSTVPVVRSQDNNVVYGNRRQSREGEIWHVAAYLLALIDTILDMVTSSQAPLVYEMKANLYIELAELSYAKARQHNEVLFSTNMNSSKAYVHSALNIYDHLKQHGKETGVDMRIKTQGMSLLAMVECQQMNYTGGLKLFEQALAIDAKWLGTLFHPSLMHRFYNAITCSLQKQQHTLKFKAMPDKNAEKDLQFIKELFMAVIKTYEAHQEDSHFAKEFKHYYELAKEKLKIQW